MGLHKPQATLEIFGQVECQRDFSGAGIRLGSQEGVAVATMWAAVGSG